MPGARRRTPAEVQDGAPPFWTLSIDELRSRLGCDEHGLSSEEAAGRLQAFGPNSDRPPPKNTVASAIGRRLLEPLSLVLLAATAVSAGTGDGVGATVIALMLVLSIGLDTLQERRAAQAAELLRLSVALKAEVLRDGRFETLDVSAIAPGDVFRLRAGDIVPADGLILAADTLTVGEAALTGEPYPVEKRPGTVVSTAPAQAWNAVFRGAVVQRGEASAWAVETGSRTLFGEAASVLAEEEGLSPFQRDLRSLGFLIARATAVLALAVLAVNVMLGRPILSSLLFSVALAVGLTPELLPMVTTVTLARGAVRLSAKKVIVKRLAAIHDLGAMTVLCTDKTGTLTSAEIVLDRSLDAFGAPDPRPAVLAAVCARLAGDRGALDAALCAAQPEAADRWRMLGRRAFDYQRRMGSVLAQGPEGPTVIVKGAPEQVLACCVTVWRPDGAAALGAEDRERIAVLLRALGDQGLRTVAIASRPWREAVRAPEAADEAELVLEGFCCFADPPKASAPAAIARLAKSGVRVVVLSGDDPVVVRRLAGIVGLGEARVLSGEDLRAMGADALSVQARQVDAYARLTPDQKVRVVRALRDAGEVVGFLGDGVNDAPGLKAADIGLSVDGATGVARAAADMILLDSDLAVVADGVEEGRRTFVNILKYVRMGASSNFGNMLSMALASPFLPFLPMLAIQVLLNNLIYDVSEVGIPFDRVGEAAVSRPQQWKLGRVARYALIMGPLSSVFDILTFVGLIAVFHAEAPVFRTAWFLESIATQILVIFLIRTAARPWADLPHPILTATTLGALVVGLALPFSPLAPWLGFASPSPAILVAIALVVALYLVSAELLKRLALAASSAPSRAGLTRVKAGSGRLGSDARAPSPGGAASR